MLNKQNENNQKCIEKEIFCSFVMKILLFVMRRRFIEREEIFLLGFNNNKASARSTAAATTKEKNKFIFISFISIYTSYTRSVHHRKTLYYFKQIAILLCLLLKQPFFSLLWMRCVFFLWGHIFHAMRSDFVCLCSSNNNFFSSCRSAIFLKSNTQKSPFPL